MLLYVVSDLHQEFSPWTPSVLNFDFDVMVVAGDNSPKLEDVDTLRKIVPNKPIILIAGNHEFYNNVFETRLQELRDRARMNDIHFLQNDSLVIGDVRFLGCTLWTDFALFNNPHLAMVQAPQNMNDYKKIKTQSGHTLTPQFVLTEHETSRKFLEDHLKTPFDGPTVVVTHHAPSGLSSKEYWKDKAGIYMTNDSDPCYASRLENLILDYSPEVWIHGHIHRRLSYDIGNTLVVANPRGYKMGREYNERTGFAEKFVIDV